MSKIRIGYGYDVHPLIVGRKLMLGGIEIPHGKGLLGHSDADVLLHAITDALLGALVLGDIGTHFPDTDPAFKNADSATLLAQAYQLIQKRGYELGNLDATLVAERPKLQPHIHEMRTRIAKILGAAIDNISLKATTSETMGFAGREEGIIAHAVVLIQKKG
jgi:2-C-methyl-D-erythritol 2,4-cyclodiphosphate synthase